jgi:squalene cyclase
MEERGYVPLLLLLEPKKQCPKNNFQDGMTAFHSAVSANQPIVAKLLVDAADVSIHTSRRVSEWKFNNNNNNNEHGDFL